MALRKSKDDKRAPDAGDEPGGAVAVEERPGESVEECVAVGQALVESGHLPSESLAGALTDGNGDLWVFWYSYRNGPATVFFKRYTADSWGPAIQLSPGNADRIAAAFTDSVGDVWAFWVSEVDYESIDDIWYRRLIASI